MALLAPFQRRQGVKLASPEPGSAAHMTFGTLYHQEKHDKN